MKSNRVHYLAYSVFLFFLALYLWGSAPSVMYHDSGELQAVALTGGITHPTGYPTFVMLGNMFGRIIPGDKGHRITVMSALFGALTLCFLFAVIMKLGMPAIYAALGAALFGFTLTFWCAAIRTEVYTLSCFFFSLGLWLTLRTLDKPSLSNLIITGVSLGLVLTNHLMFIIMVIFLLIVLLIREPAPGIKRMTHVSVLLLAFCFGLLPYLYLFWADSADLPLNYIDYTVEVRANQFGFTHESFNNPFERILWLVSSNEYKHNITSLNLRHLAKQIQHRGIYEYGYHYGPLALPLLFLGIVNLRRKLGGKWLIILGLFLISPIFGILFAKGRMIPVFTLPLTLCSAIILSLGSWRLTEWFGNKYRRAGARQNMLLLILLGALVVIPHAIRYHTGKSMHFPKHYKYEFEQAPHVETFVPSFRNHWEPRIYGESVLDAAPDSSMIIGKWNEITVFFYLHHSEGLRPDITLEPYSHVHYVRLLDWQERYGVNSHPFVFLFPVELLGKNLSVKDSLNVYGQNYIYFYNDSLPSDFNNQ